VVGRLNLRDADAPSRLETWLRQPHMIGIRATFHTRPYVDWLDDGSLEWFWEGCERLNIPVMALVPGMVHKLAPIAERHRHLALVIPHMGCPFDVRGAAAFRGLSDLQELAHFPRVAVMVSSAPCFSCEPYPFRDLHPFLERIFEAYGPSRILWGADLSRLTSTYRECLDLFRLELGFLTASDKQLVLGGALAKVFKWQS
jgi:predicted TIM-barrel fold metal-dependent hydrolase